MTFRFRSLLKLNLRFYFIFFVIILYHRDTSDVGKKGWLPP